MSSLLLNYNENEKKQDNSNRLEFTDLINGSRKIAKKASFNSFTDTYNKYINDNANIELQSAKNNFFNEDTKKKSNSSNGNMNNFNRPNNHLKQDKNDDFENNVYNQNLLVNNKESFDTTNSTINSLNDEISDLKRKLKLVYEKDDIFTN